MTDDAPEKKQKGSSGDAPSLN